MEGTLARDAVLIGTAQNITKGRCRVWGVNYQVTAVAGGIEILDGSGGPKKFELQGIAPNSSDFIPLPGILCLNGAFINFTNMTNLLIYVN